MDIFDQLKTVASDHGTLWDVFRASEQAAQLAENSERWAELARRFGGLGAGAND